MQWDIEGTSEFEEWYGSLTASEQDAIDFVVALLEEHGPRLGRPYADTVRGSRHPNLKELRAQSAGRPLRIFFAFDPRRTALLLLGGDKTGNPRFYDQMLPKVDALYADHLETLEAERDGNDD